MPGPASFFAVLPFGVFDSLNDKSVLAAIALGSNLGDRSAFIRRATEALDAASQVKVLQRSVEVETAPEGVLDQPQFLNAAVLVHTTLSPMQLLDTCQAIERALGRDRAVQQKWGPRTIDLDILLYGQEVIDQPGLCVPHIHMLSRAFVLVPLAQIGASISIPGAGMTVNDALNKLNNSTRSSS